MNEAVDQKVFQIGFNKCGTRTIYRLFKTSGYKSAHWEKGRLAKDIHYAKKMKEKPLVKWPDVVLFSDMECVDDPDYPAIESYKDYEFLDGFYPDSKFILNTRDRERWLRSRLNHGGGDTLKVIRGLSLRRRKRI